MNLHTLPKQTNMKHHNNDKGDLMKRHITLLTFAFFLCFAGIASGMKDGDHAKMDHGSSHDEMGHFKHAAMVDEIHAEFQIMSLASMNMKDPDGKTHHVMASFQKDDHKIEKAVGKVKLISPTGKEQISPLKHYGGGAYAANFTFDESGKWGVICLFKDQEGKHTVKFWYTHH